MLGHSRNGSKRVNQTNSVKRLLEIAEKQSVCKMVVAQIARSNQVVVGAKFLQLWKLEPRRVYIDNLSGEELWSCECERLPGRHNSPISLKTITILL